jgi:hypothetical protein
VDRGAFRRFIKYCRPSLSNTDIPHRTTLRKEILACAKVVEDHVKEELQVCKNIFYNHSHSFIVTKIFKAQSRSCSIPGRQRQVTHFFPSLATTLLHRSTGQMHGSLRHSNWPSPLLKVITLDPICQRL